MPKFSKSAWLTLGVRQPYSGEMRSTVGFYWNTAEGRPAGFDLLRIALAMVLVFWHSFPLSYGLSANNDGWTGPVRPLIFFIVPSFFALSGFLVAGSLQRN